MAATATERKLLLDGAWTETGEWVDVASPYDGSFVARVAKAGASENRARSTPPSAAMREPLPAHKRAEILVRVAGALGRRADEAGAPDLGRGGQSLKAGPGRGRPRDVDLHDGRCRGAEAGGRDDPHGRFAGR